MEVPTRCTELGESTSTAMRRWATTTAIKASAPVQGLATATRATDLAVLGLVPPSRTPFSRKDKTLRTGSPALLTGRPRCGPRPRPTGVLEPEPIARVVRNKEAGPTVMVFPETSATGAAS